MHGRTEYDGLRDVVLDEYVRERREREEWNKTRELFREMEQSDLYYDFVQEAESMQGWYRYPESKDGEGIPLGTPEKDSIGTSGWDLLQIRERESLLVPGSQGKLKVIENRTKIVREVGTGDEVLFYCITNIGFGMQNNKIWQILDYRLSNSSSHLLVTVKQSEQANKSEETFSVIKNMKTGAIYPARMLHKLGSQDTPTTSDTVCVPSMALISESLSRIVYLQHYDSQGEKRYKILCHQIGSENSLSDLCLFEGKLAFKEETVLTLSSCGKFVVMSVGDLKFGSSRIFVADLVVSKPNLIEVQCRDSILRGLTISGDHTYGYTSNQIFFIQTKALAETLRARQQKVGISQNQVLAHEMRQKKKSEPDTTSSLNIPALILQEDIAAISSQVPQSLLPGVHQPPQIEFLSIQGKELALCIKNRGCHQFYASHAKSSDLAWNPHNVDIAVQTAQLVGWIHHSSGLDIWIAPFRSHREMHSLKFSMSIKSPVQPETRKLYSVESKRTITQMENLKNNEKLVFAPCLDGEVQPLLLIYKGACRSAMNTPGKLLLVSHLYQENKLDYTHFSHLLHRGWTVAITLESTPVTTTTDLHLNVMKKAQKLVSTVNYLTAKNYTHNSLLCGYARGFDSCVLAAAVNMRPSVFKAVGFDTPVLDLCGILVETQESSDPSSNQMLALELNRYFGGTVSSSQKIWDAVRMTCPLKNIQKAEYPATLITHDKGSTEVPHWSSLKYLSQLRAKSVKNSRLNPTLEQFTLADRDNALQFSYFEWIVEEMSTDLERLHPEHPPEYARSAISTTKLRV